MGKEALKFRIIPTSDGRFKVQQRIKTRWLLQWITVGTYPDLDTCYDKFPYLSTERAISKCTQEKIHDTEPAT